MAAATQAEQGKKKKKRRFHPLRTLIILICLVIVTAVCEPFLYYTPLYPLGEGAVGLVTFAAESIQELTESLTSLSWRHDDSSSQDSSYPLTILVNRWNPVPDDIRCRLVVIEDDKSVDARCADDLKQMLSDCRAEGLRPIIRSAYRSYGYQTDLFNNKIERLRAEGRDADAAYNEAMTVVALPGTSELGA